MRRHLRGDGPDLPSDSQTRNHPPIEAGSTVIGVEENAPPIEVPEVPPGEAPAAGVSAGTLPEGVAQPPDGRPFMRSIASSTTACLAAHPVRQTMEQGTEAQMSRDLQRVCVSLGVLFGGLLAADKALSGFAKTVDKFRLDDHFEVATSRKNADGRHTTLTAEHSRIPGGVVEEVALYGQCCLASSVVGLDGLEPTTSVLSGPRSNRLSYRPSR